MSRLPQAECGESDLLASKEIASPPMVARNDKDG
jgi:hypothetical protein